MKTKSLLFAIVLAALSAGAFAFEWGGALANYTRIKGKDFSSLKLDQVDDLSLWIKTPFDKDGKLYLAAEGLYEFEYDAAAKKNYNRLDLSLLKFQGSWDFSQKKISLSAGRFVFSDYTGLIMRQGSDGLFLSCEFSRAAVQAYASYTGLLNANIVKMLDHPKDTFKVDSESVYCLAQKYAAAALSVSFPSLFSKHTLALQALGTFKLEGVSYNRIYATLFMTGPVWQSLYYSASATMSFASYDGAAADISNLSRACLNYYLPFKSLAFGLGAVYASKDFRGFTKCDAFASLADPQYSGLVKVEATASIKPISVLLAKAGAGLVFDAGDSTGYRGVEWSASVDWQVFSDAKIGASYVQYLDKDKSESNKVQFSINALITF